MPTTTRIARVFDGATNGVPFYLPDHPRLEPAERTGPLAYLEGGALLLMTTGTEPDFVEPERGELVPMSFRTDGYWIWNDAVAYYLTEYGYAPEPEFLAAMQAADWTCPTPDEATLDRVLSELYGE
jgi:hypothetical protein